MKINNFHNRIATYVKNSPNTQKFLKTVEKNPAYVNSLLCAGVGIAMKPATILLMPSKTNEMKKDNQYSIARSVSTGLIDFIFALALFIPLNKHIDKVGRNLYNKKGSIYYQNKEIATNAKSMLNRGLRIATLPIFAILKFKYIDKTAKILFDKKGKSDNDK